MKPSSNKILLLILPLLIIMIMGFKMYSLNKSNAAKPVTGYAVIELFTSEGCSSCPPADEAIAALEKQYDGPVMVLEFHVDYWDRLGWRDPFSNAAYTSRQQEYGAHFNLQSIYTPQAIINGKMEFVGSDKEKINNAIKTELTGLGNRKIELTARLDNGGSIQVVYKADLQTNNVLNIALVQLHAETNVKAGENAGKQLRHNNIVRDFVSNSLPSGIATLHVPKGYNSKDYNIIAFIQDSKSRNILGALNYKL